MTKNKSYMRIALLTAATGTFYAVSFWLALPIAITLVVCIMNHCDAHTEICRK